MGTGLAEPGVVGTGSRARGTIPSPRIITAQASSYTWGEATRPVCQGKPAECLHQPPKRQQDRDNRLLQNCPGRRGLGGGVAGDREGTPIGPGGRGAEARVRTAPSDTGQVPRIARLLFCSQGPADWRPEMKSLSGGERLKLPPSALLPAGPFLCLFRALSHSSEQILNKYFKNHRLNSVELLACLHPGRALLLRSLQCTTPVGGDCGAGSGHFRRRHLPRRWHSDLPEAAWTRT